MELAWRDTVRFEKRWAEDWAVWALRAALVVAAAAAVLAPPLEDTSPGPLVGTAVAALAAALFVSAIRTRRPRTMRIVELALLATASVHMAGHLFGFYQTVPWYDTVLHGFGGFALGMSAWGLSVATDWFWNHDEETPFRAFYLVTSFVAIGVLATEFFEFASDVFLGTSEQTDPIQAPLYDTMIDLGIGMVMGLLAALIVAYLTWRGRRYGFEDVVEEPKAAPRDDAGEPGGV